MDIFTKVKSHLEKIGSPRRSSASNLLHKFQICWDTIQFEMQVESNVSRSVDRTDISASLQQILDILLKEQRMLESGHITTTTCADMFLNDDMLGKLVKLSESDRPEGFRKEVISMISGLVSLLECRSLENASLNGAVTALMRWAVKNKSGSYEEEMMELESNIATKIHELPTLLNIFFTKSSVPKNVTPSAVASTSPPQLGGLVGIPTLDHPIYDFPLFDHLMRYVHIEGRLGDVARTSCLLLLEINQEDLQEYITHSEFALTVTAGLGGLFSQLPHQLPARSVILGRQGYAAATFTRDIDSFLNLLLFIHQILERRVESTSLSEALIYQFTHTFLHQVVKPQLETASDFDGTTVAVLFYITKMLETLPPESGLSTVLVTFLFHSDDNNNTTDDAVKDVELHLKDILLSKLNSISDEVVVGVMKLLDTVIGRHARVGTIMLFETLGTETLETDAQSYLAILKRYFDLLASDICYQTDDGLSFDSYLDDAETALHNSYRSSPLHHQSAQTKPLETPQSTEKMLYPLTRDPALAKLLQKFTTFFSQTPKINLALTGVVTLLMASPQPLLAFYLSAVDLHIPESKSLYTLLLELKEEMEKKREAMGLEAFKARRNLVDWDDEVIGDEEDSFVKNAMILEEFRKEVLAGLVVGGGADVVFV